MGRDSQASAPKGIRAALAGKTLLVSGATGFLGKALIEKLLFEIPAIKRIYLLIRPRGGDVPAQARLKADIFSSPLFQRLRTREEGREGFEAFLGGKVVAVEGDLMQVGLGLADEDLRRLAKEIDLIINSAATVQFDERLDLALNLNTLGPQRLLALAKSCLRRPLLVQVSTCYVGGKLAGPIPEQVLEQEQTISHLRGDANLPPFNVDEEIRHLFRTIRQIIQESHHPERRVEIVALAREQLLNGQAASKRQGSRAANGGQRLAEVSFEAARGQWIARRLVSEGMSRAQRYGWNDTYTFTKALGEKLLVRDHGAVPLIILRPSIIESSLREPEAGWIEGYRMADPMIAAYGLGKLRKFSSRREVVLDVIPLDVVVNTLIAAMAHPPAAGHVVYQTASGSRVPLTIGRLADYIFEYFRDHPMRTRKGQPIRVKPWRLQPQEEFQRHLYWRSFLPVKMLHRVLRSLAWLPFAPSLLEKVGKLRNALEQLRHLSTIYAPYTNHSPLFETKATEKLFDLLREEDRQRFNFSLADLDWEHYVKEVHIPGLIRNVIQAERPPRLTAISPVPLADEATLAAWGEAPIAEMIAPASMVDPLTEAEFTLWNETDALEEDVAGIGMGEARDQGAAAATTLEELEQAEASRAAPLPTERPLRLRRRLAIPAVPAILAPQRRSPLTFMQVAFRDFIGVLGLIANRVYFRSEVTGLDHLPTDGAFIVASNHCSHLDTTAVILSMGPYALRACVVGARDYFFNTRLKAWFFGSLLKAIPFDRQGNFIAGIRQCREALMNRTPVLIYPEGTRSLTGMLQPFKLGVGVLAYELKVPVVPAYVSGTYQALPKGSWFPRPYKVRVRFGPPLTPSAATAEDDRDGSPYTAYVTLVRRLRQAIEELRDASATPA
ncbi:MAG: SDR family oxidoreductase [Candidatus Tectomicrobia bacterium]|nr:SDR family oxidoreductase [Candidatus Tectomicrobia bacterium]